MEFSSRAQLDSDAIPTRALNLHSNAANSSPSEHSDTRPDPLQRERELAHEVLNQDVATVKQDDHVKRPTIMYEEALERELEYANRIKMGLLQHQYGTGLLCEPSQELPSKPSLGGVKRKAVSGVLAEPPPFRGSHVSTPPPELFRPQLQQQKFPLQRSINQPPNFQGTPLLPLPYGQPLAQQLQQQKRTSPRPINHPPNFQGTPLRPFGQPPSQRPINQPPNFQGTQPARPFQRSLPQQQPCNQQTPNYQETPLWCNLCKVKCGTPQNMASHSQGKKHKANLAMKRNRLTMLNGAGCVRQAPSSGQKQAGPSS